jgi:hypothetical protein
MSRRAAAQYAAGTANAHQVISGDYRDCHRYRLLGGGSLHRKLPL